MARVAFYTYNNLFQASERYCLVPTQGNDPWSNAYQACALPLSYAGEISTALRPMQVSKHTESSSPTMSLRPARYASIRSVFSHTTRSASHPRGRPHSQFKVLPARVASH